MKQSGTFPALIFGAMGSVAEATHAQKTITASQLRRI
jgi:hypothetical protein